MNYHFNCYLSNIHYFYYLIHSFYILHNRFDSQLDLKYLLLIIFNTGYSIYFNLKLYFIIMLMNFLFLDFNPLKFELL